jgi:hypothetical protein
MRAEMRTAASGSTLHDESNNARQPIKPNSLRNDLAPAGARKLMMKSGLLNKKSSLTIVLAPAQLRNRGGNEVWRIPRCVNTPQRGAASSHWMYGMLSPRYNLAHDALALAHAHFISLG